MSEILKLEDDSGNNYNLLSGSIRLERGGYDQKTASPAFDMEALPYGGTAKFVRFPPVTEVIRVSAEDSADNILAAENEIQTLLERARGYFTDLLQPDAVWIYATSAGETIQPSTQESKRALVYHGSLALDMPDRFRGGFLGSAFWGKLSIARHPLWEDTEGGSISDLSLGLWDDTLDLTSHAQYMGNAPARVGAVGISGWSADSHITKLWLGIRPTYEGITDFEPVWELEDGTNGTDTTTQTVSGASSGDAKQVTFATSTDLERRVTIQLADAHSVSNYIHFMGRYLVLCRCKVDASTEVNLKMHHGFVDTIYSAQEDAIIDNTAWQLIELGEVTIPPRGWRAAGSFFYNNLSGYAIGIDAERLSGTGYLYLDALYFIPSEHMITVDEMSDGFEPMLSVITTPDDQLYCLVRSAAATSIPRLNPSLSPHNWYIPVDPGFCVLAAQPDTDHSLTETAQITFNYRPRWKMYRTGA